MIEKGFVTRAEWKAHVFGEWRTVHGLWPHLKNYVPGWGYSKAEIDAFFEGESAGKKQVHWDRVVSKPSSFNPSAHSLVGAVHTASGLTTGHYLRATGASSFAFQAIQAGDLPSHSHVWTDVSKVGSVLNDLGNVAVANPDDWDVLRYNTAGANWVCSPLSYPTHNLLSATHPDTIAGSPVQGALIYGDGTPKWTKLTKGSTGQILRSTAVSIAWGDLTAGDLPAHASKHHLGGGDEVNHDSLAGFVASEHLSLPNTMANVLSSYVLNDLSNVAVASPSDWDVLRFNQAGNNWVCSPLPGASPHNLLSSSHSDTIAGNPVQGDIIYAEGTPKWAKLTKGSAGQYLRSHTVGVGWSNIERIEISSFWDTPFWANIPDKPSTFPPSAHKTSHQSGGGDSIKLDDLAIPDDNTDLNATTTRHGLLLKLGGGTINFLRADGTWAAPGTGCDKEFRAYVGTAQSVGAGATVVVQFNTENYDPDGAWYPGTYRLQPGAGNGGTFRVHACIHTYLDANKSHIIYIYKNGSEYARVRYLHSTAGYRSMQIASDVGLGNADYIDIRYYNGNASSATIDAGSAYSWVNGFRITP